MLLRDRTQAIVINLWPGDAPGEVKPLPPEEITTPPGGRLVAGQTVKRIGNVSVPMLTVYKPDPKMDTGTSIIIAPGGGFNILAYDLEGTEVAEWLNSIGITGIVLKYRVPSRNEDPRWKAAVQDAQRAVSLVRSRADQWGINPDKIGLMGFSAGAQAAGLTTLFNARQYAPVDEVDPFSFKPDFTGLIYLGREMQNEPGVVFYPELPPIFMTVAHDDQDRSIVSAELYVALKKVGANAELHIFERGGHGYGLRPTEIPVTHWNKTMEVWLHQIGML
ncbi:MAG: alpha/beta hydrolase [Verrucomicrobiae bacterium]|nr:alpha/beta hydrolase [Verrucomicrobiae bacterium]